MTTTTYYRLVLSFLGTSAGSYSPEWFDTIDDAKTYFNKEYKNRNEGDGHDEYWNNIPMVIQKVITVIEDTLDERTNEQKAASCVHNIDGKYKYLNCGIWSSPFDTKESCIYAYIQLFL